MTVAAFTNGVIYGRKTAMDGQHKTTISRRRVDDVDSCTTIEPNCRPTLDKSIHQQQRSLENNTHIRRRWNVVWSQWSSDEDNLHEDAQDEAVVHDTYPIDEIIDPEEYEYRNSLSIASQIQYAQGYEVEDQRSLSDDDDDDTMAHLLLQANER